MGGALEGVRILDLTWGVGGPLAVLQLAEQGADVIKIEPPGGDPFRPHPGYPVWNRSRRSVTLDLKSDDGLHAMRGLIGTADVLVESFRPGVMQRLGLGYEEVHAANPALVYASLSGYPRGHRAEQRPGYDALVQARSGIQWEQPGWRDGPIFHHLNAPSMAAQFLLQFGVTAALLVREETGHGQHVTTSLYQGALAFTTMLWQHLERAGADHHAVLAKTYPPGVHQRTIFECANGEWIHAATMNGRTPTMSVEDVLGVEDAPDFMTLMGMSPDERAQHEQRIAEAYRRHDRDELVQRFHQAELGAEAVRRPEEMFDHAQLIANGTVVEVDDPAGGPSVQVGPVMTLFGTPGGVKGPQPAPGQHTEEVLRELESLPKATATPRSPASQMMHALEGVTVLDFGQYLAGPIGPMIMADLGADVIKVEPVRGDSMRFVSGPFTGCQRGKRDIAIDLKSEEGLAVAHDLVRHADVVHHNMTKGKAEKLGLDYETCRGLRPDIIYCNTFAYGHEGPLSHFGGLDPLYQAAVGLEHEAGPVDAGKTPLYNRLGMSDTANGFASVQAILLALFHRARTGEGQSVTTSLLSASALYSSDVWREADGTVHKRPPLDPDQCGTTATYRLYRTQDGWLQLAAVTDEEFAALCSAIKSPDLADDERFATPEMRLQNREELTKVVGAAMSRKTSRTWQLELDDADVPAEVPIDTQGGEQVLWDADNVALGLVTEYDHPAAGRMRQFGELIGFSDTPGRIEDPPPMLGQHTREVLVELGYADDKIGALLDSGAVIETPDEYGYPV